MARKGFAPFRKGQYTVQEYGVAIQREKRMMEKCEREGSPITAQYFRDSLETLIEWREKEKG